MQAFWRFSCPFPPGAVSEDNILQHEVERRGLRAAYVPLAVVVVSPPHTLPEILRRRLRYISTAGWFRRTYHATPPTQSVRTVGAAILTGLRERRLPLVGLCGFIVLEATGRFLLAMTLAFRGHAGTVAWRPIASTKSPPWRSSRVAASSIPRATEPSLPAEGP